MRYFLNGPFSKIVHKGAEGGQKYQHGLWMTPNGMQQPPQHLFFILTENSVIVPNQFSLCNGQMATVKTTFGICM